MSDYDDFENYDNDWGNDPFEGDMDFDMDFDNPGGKKGFLRSAVSGFLDGIVERTIGSTDVKINTLQKVLPTTWNPTFRNLRDLNQKRREIAEQIKNGSFSTVQDLQYLAERASKAAGDYLPNKISGALNDFSKRDFSDWEKVDYDRDDTDRVGDVNEDEVKALISSEEANAVLGRANAKSIGKQTIGMMAEIGGRSIANIQGLNQTAMRTNQLLEHLLDFQRRVTQRNDQLLISITARQYLTSSKYYKFMEVSNHRVVTELKQIGEYVKMSDYEKTTHMQALKKSVRGTLFDKAKSRFGGISDYLTERVGKDTLDDNMSSVSDITSSLRMVAEMTEGMPINVGSMLGNAAAGIFLNKLPQMIESGLAQGYIAKFKKQYPKLAKWADDAYIRLSDLGNVASYVTGNGEELANTLHRHNKSGFSELDDLTYEDYIDTLGKDKDGKDKNPMPKPVWQVMKLARDMYNKGTGAIMDDMWESSYTTYNLQNRTLADGEETALWSRRSDRTLNEEIPRWFSMIHLSLEQIRTGSDDVKRLSYDYVKDNFITNDQKVATVTNAVFDRSQFSSQASSALNLAESIDKEGGGVMSKQAKQDLAYQLTRDVDRKQGFNPWNLLELENEEGFNKDSAKQIRETLMSAFGITDAHIGEFHAGDEATRTRMLTYMPTEKGRRLLPGMADAARSLDTFMPDISNNLDTYRNNGFWDAMLQAGIISKSEWGGGDEVSEQKFWDMYRRYLANPEMKSTVPVPESPAYIPTRPMGGLNSFTPPINPMGSPIPPFVLGGSAGTVGANTGPIQVKVEGFAELVQSLDGLKSLGQNLGGFSDAMKTVSAMDFRPLNDKMDMLVKSTGDLLQLAQVRNDTLVKIQEGLPPKKKVTKQEEEDMRSGTQRIMDRVKEFSFQDFYNKAVDTVLKNEPLILGGLLGGLAGYALHNPKAAALIAGGAVAATAYGRIRSVAKAKAPEDSEDLYEEGSDEPILTAQKLRDGDYYDLSKKAIIQSWKDITGSIKDIKDGTVIGARKLAGKLFTAENKEVFLSGLNKIREWITKAFRWVDPWNRLVNAKDKVAKRFFQMDVYKEGSRTPTLIGKSFEGGAYYKVGPDGKAVMLTGWNEIDGPVYDREGNILITQEDYDRGLVTSMGVSVNKLANASKKLAGWGFDLLKIGKDKAAVYGVQAFDKSKEIFKADYTPIVNSIDRIYDLLLLHWGYLPNNAVPDPLAPVQADGTPSPDETPVAGKGKKKKVPKVAEDTPLDPNKGINPDVAGPSKEEVSRREEEAERPSQVRKHDFSQTIKDKIDALMVDKPSVAPSAQEAKPGEPKPRLNSLADQEDQKERKKANRVQDAIIRIGESFGFGDKKPDTKRAGLFGLLGTMFGGAVSILGGIATFMTKALFGPIKLLGTFASMGLTVLPAMLTGITAMAKGLFTLLKTKSLTDAGTSVLDTIMDNKNENPETRAERKRRRGEHRRKPGTKLKKAGMVGGVALAGGMAMDGLIDSGIVEEDGLMANVANVVETGANVYAGYQLASGLLGLAGVSLSGVIGTTASAIGTGLLVGAGGVLTAAGAILTSPIALGAAAVGLVGYGAYKLFQKGKGTQLKLRLTQYGVSDVESELAEKIVKAEQMLEKFVVIGNGRASLSKDAPIEEVFRLFVPDAADKGGKAKVAEVFTWFNGRFKPVFLTYLACLDAAKFKGLQEYDESTKQDVYMVAKQAHAALGSVAPFPYTIVAKIDPDTPLLADKQTVIRVNNYLTTLKQYVDRKTDKEDLQPVALPAGVKALEQEKKQLEEQLASNDDSLTRPLRGKAKDRIAEIDKQLSGLSSGFKLGKQVQAVYIKDLLPDDKAMDLLTAIRLACYGNDQDVHWRVEAVLRLERFCESLFVNDGKEVVFRGDIGELFDIFRTSFRLKRDEGEDWAKWFRDRFAPVMRNYVQLVGNYRKGNPGVVWKSLSVTARYEIARALVDTQVHVTDSLIVPIWKVRASPFLDARSPDRPDKVDRMLKLLGDSSTQAKILDPEKEAGKTNTQAWANTISPHKVGGGFTPHAANVQQVDQYQNKRDVAMGGQFGTNTSSGAGTGNVYSIGGNFGTPENKYGYKALTGESDTSHLDMTGVQKDTSRKDSGVKVPRKLAEQLMIREMLKQGFTDPRAIAEMLALTNYETGGYSKTVENLKYTDPSRLMRTFREVTSLAQAQQLVQAGEVAIGNTVYGGGKGASIGNKEPGDGYKYRGRGFVQLTGKANYAKTGQALGIDLVGKPELLSEDPNVMAAVAVDFYKNSKLLQSITQDGNFGRAARGLNGGNELPGMGDRHRLYLSYLEQLGKGELKADEESAVAASKDTVGSEPLAPPSNTAAMIGGPGGTPPLGASGSGGQLDPTGGAAYGSPANSGGGNYGSPGTSGEGGGKFGGGYTGVGYGASPAVDADGLRVKSAETTGGGGHHPAIKRLGELIQTNVQNFNRFTALNDAWHKHNKPNSKHTQGLALDFTLTNGAAGSDAAVNVVKGLLQQAGLTPNEFLVLNEYRRMSRGATGNHVHAGFQSAAAADKFMAASGGNATNGQDTTAGGGPVQPKEQDTAPPQMGVEAQAPRGAMEEPTTEPTGTAPGKPSIPGPKPPQKGGNVPQGGNDPYGTNPGNPYQQPGGPGNGYQRPAPQTGPQAQPAPQTAPMDGGNVDALLGNLLQAINSQGGANTQLLSQIANLLAEANKGAKNPSERINV